MAIYQSSVAQSTLRRIAHQLTRPARKAPLVAFDLRSEIAHRNCMARSGTDTARSDPRITSCISQHLEPIFARQHSRRSTAAEGFRWRLSSKRPPAGHHITLHLPLGSFFVSSLPIDTDAAGSLLLLRSSALCQTLSHDDLVSRLTRSSRTAGLRKSLDILIRRTFAGKRAQPLSCTR